MRTLKNLRAALAIDKHNLDDMVMQQPMLYMDVSEEASKAINVRDSDKVTLKELEASESVRITSELTACAKKPTAAQVTASVTTSEVVKVAKDRLQKSTQEARLWEDLKEAYIQRSHALKELANLAVSGYYQRDSVRAGTTVQLLTPEKKKKKKKKG